MILEANKIYKIDTCNEQTCPSLVRNPNGADILVGFKAVHGAAPAIASLDNIGHSDDLVSIVDLLASCDYVATTGNDVYIAGLCLKEV